MGESPRRRWPWIAAGAVIAIAIGAAFGVLRYRDDVQEVTIDDAVEDFQTRATTAATPATNSADVIEPAGVDVSSPESEATITPDTEPVPQPLVLPTAGVYDFASSGREEVDLLSGAVHDYPAETAVVVEPFGCGISLTWTPFVERTEGWEACLRDGGIAIVGYTATHEFFNTHEVRRLVCAEPAWLVPPPDSPTAMTTTCTGDGLTEVRSTTIVGVSAATVEGEDVPTLEMLIEVATSGSTTGASTRRLVVDSRSGLPVTWQDTVENTTPTAVGDAHYLETFTLQLMSLSPRT